VRAEYLINKDALWEPLAREDRKDLAHNFIYYTQMEAVYLEMEQLCSTDEIWETHIAARQKFEASIIGRMLRKFRTYSLPNFGNAIPELAGNYKIYPMPLDRILEAIDNISNRSPDDSVFGFGLAGTRQRTNPSKSSETSVSKKLPDTAIPINAGDLLELFIDVALTDNEYIAVLREAGEQYELCILSGQNIEQVSTLSTSNAGEWSCQSSDGQTKLSWQKVLLPNGEQSLWIFIVDQTTYPAEQLCKILGYEISDNSEQTNTLQLANFSSEDLDLQRDALFSEKFREIQLVVNK
jgi:hypothetical protein